MTRLARFLWSGPTLFVLSWLGLLAVGSRFLRDPGQFWHTVVGEKVLTDGFFDTDPFTFSHAGEKWIPHQWLGEVVMALVHRVGGFDSLLVVTVAIVAALYAWLTVKYIRHGWHPLLALAVTLSALAVASTHFHVRPHLFTMIGMTASMHAVIEFENRRIGLKQLAWLIPLYLVWTNTHGGMLGGLTTMALAVIGWGVWRALGWESPLTSWRVAGGVLVVGTVCGLTAFVTPYGAEIARTWLYINNGMSRLPEIIVEHARLTPADPKSWPLFGFGAIYLFMLAGVLPNRPKVAWLVPLFWLVQGVLRVRHGALFAPMAALAILDMWPHTRWANWMAERRPHFYSPPSAPHARTLLPILVTALACIGVAFALQRSGMAFPLFGSGCAKFDPRHWPTEMTDELKRIEPTSPGQPDHMFCDFLYGGYLIYHTPGYKVFVDDRCELFGDDWLIEFVNAEREGTADAMARWQARFGRFDFALTTTHDRDVGYDGYFRTSGEWELVKKTDTATLYRRR